MKRRGFLQFLGLSTGAAASGIAIASAGDDSRGIVYRCKCSNDACGIELSQFIDLTGPVTARNQCPRCLYTLDFSNKPDSLAQQIKQWNIAHGHKTTIYTPRRI